MFVYPSYKLLLSKDALMRLLQMTYCMFLTCFNEMAGVQAVVNYAGIILSIIGMPWHLRLMLALQAYIIRPTSNFKLKW